MKHKVYLGHFGNIQKGKGLNISVVRIPPSPAEINTQDISVWLQDLSPSLSLLSRYKANQLTNLTVRKAHSFRCGMDSTHKKCV